MSETKDTKDLGIKEAVSESVESTGQKKRTLYTFHRNDGFYSLELGSDDEARANAVCNPGTVRVANELTKSQVWPPLRPGFWTPQQVADIHWSDRGFRGIAEQHNKIVRQLYEVIDEDAALSLTGESGKKEEAVISDVRPLIFDPEHYPEDAAVNKLVLCQCGHTNLEHTEDGCEISGCHCGAFRAGTKISEQTRRAADSVEDGNATGGAHQLTPNET